ncbi:MAG TPA: M17 family peptidase N-terminal domain-containing protein [Kofleriaceae bacterium]|nr:M17 family peptidase N-terminal domain-containing protein [Kofleriaceae bacterium]
MHFLTSDLAKWDETAGDLDALVLTVFADERPLRGAAGLADWRLCGRLSRLIVSGHLFGESGEALLYPPGRRLPFARTLVFGLGLEKAFDEAAYRRHVRHIRDALARAHVERYAIAPPGRATGLIAARRALELWLDEEAKDGRTPEVAIIDTPGGQKEMADILHVQKRMAAARQKAPKV